MERLWSPWRARYIASGVDAQKDGCVFCAIARDPEHDEENFVLHRAQHCFVLLNLYPYISGHLMIVPYLHTSEFDSTAKEITDEMMDQTKRAMTAVREVYKPAGFNTVSYTHLRAHETPEHLVCCILLEKKKPIFLI